MMPIAAFARARLRGAPDFAALAKSGTGLQNKALIRAARAMATAAAPHADVFSAARFPPDTIAQLGAAASALETSITEWQNAKVSRVLATKGIHEELKNGREAAAMLNAAVSKQLVNNTTVLAAWRVAYRVTAKQGAVRVAAAPAPIPPSVNTVNSAPEVKAAG